MDPNDSYKTRAHPTRVAKIAPLAQTSRIESAGRFLYLEPDLRRTCLCYIITHLNARQIMLKCRIHVAMCHGA